MVIFEKNSWTKVRDQRGYTPWVRLWDDDGSRFRFLQIYLDDCLRLIKLLSWIWSSMKRKRKFQTNHTRNDSDNHHHHHRINERLSFKHDERASIWIDSDSEGRSQIDFDFSISIIIIAIASNQCLFLLLIFFWKEGVLSSL